MKYIIIPIIALGFTLCSLIGVEYICNGQEMFPDFYGSPFIFKRENLASFMEYYYSITGLFLNVIVWSALLFAIHFFINRSINTTKNPKLSRVFYYSFADVFVLFAILNFYTAYLSLGSGFDKNSNYWYWDLSEEAHNWGVYCEYKWSLLQVF